MARAIWKGAISFGLVHIPVALVSATSSNAIDFDWLDKRTMEPVGYKRINKVSGKELKADNIVKGIQYEKGRYVILSEEEIKAAHPKTTQSIDIFSFVDQTDIPITHIEVPYYLSPDKRGEKVYALLRKALEATGKVALAHVILHTRQHLAVLMPLESALVLILLRWPSEVRSMETLELGKAVSQPELNKSELDMAKRLIEDMAAQWAPDEYQDTFQEKIMALVDKKVHQGKIENVEPVSTDEERKSADIIDLTELLKRSLGGKSPAKISPTKTSTAKVKSISKTTASTAKAGSKKTAATADKSTADKSTVDKATKNTSTGAKAKSPVSKKSSPKTTPARQRKSAAR